MIAIVINSLGRGGAERSTLQLSCALAGRGVDFRLIVMGSDGPEHGEAAGLETKIVRLNASSLGHALRPLYAELNRLAPRIIYAVMPQACLAATLCSKLLNIPLITSERSTPRLFYRSRLKRTVALLAHALARHTVFLSQYAIANGLAGSCLARRIRRKASVLHNPVPCPLPAQVCIDTRIARLERLERFLGAESAERGGNPGPLRILIASRLAHGKGIAEFLADAAAFLKRHEVEVFVAGDGPLRRYLEKHCDELGIANKVSFAGFVEDVWPLYSNADVVVLPSESEGFGRVGFEAYQAGCLVIGTPRNSFPSEIAPRAPAWAIVPNFRNLEGALLRFLYLYDEITRYADLDAMRAALSVEAHVSRFIAIAEMQGYSP